MKFSKISNKTGNFFALLILGIVIIKTLLDWTNRKAGTYNDSWDGRDNSGKNVAEGDYYAVLFYKENGQTKRLDLRNSTGGTQFNPTRNNAAWSFAPFDNNPMNITFHLDKAVEVTAFIGYSYSNTRVVTFYSCQPMAKGDHNILNGMQQITKVYS